LVLVLLLGAGPTRADDDGADEAFRALKHRVIVSEILIAPLADFPSSQAALAALRKLSRPEIQARNGFWRFHFVAFMEPSPDTAEVQMVMTDVTEPRHRREVKVFEADTGKLRGVLVAEDEQLVAVSFEGHYRAPAAESELVYVVQTRTSQDTYTPSQFAGKFKLKNVPAKVSLFGK